MGNILKNKRYICIILFILFISVCIWVSIVLIDIKEAVDS